MLTEEGTFGRAVENGLYNDLRKLEEENAALKIKVAELTSTNIQSAAAMAAQIADKISITLGHISVFNIPKTITDIHVCCQQLRTL